MQIRTLRALSLPVALLVAVALTPSNSAHSRPRAHTHRGVAVIRVAPPKQVSAQGDIGFIDLRVKPLETRLWINGIDRGTVKQLKNPKGVLALPSGIHRLRLVMPDGTEATREIRILPGSRTRLGVDLR